jgi:hypothetical protein
MECSFRTSKTHLPAEDQEITSPFLFVKEMMMLLKVAEI